MWMKEKWFIGQVQGEVQSSTSKVRFGGCCAGWQGERSVPVTSAEGKASAMSLERWVLVWNCAGVVLEQEWV